MNAKRVTNARTPISNNDLATKAYLDTRSSNIDVSNYLKGYSDEKTRFFKKSQILKEMPPKCFISFSHNEFNLLSPTFHCYSVEILVFHSICHFWYVACILIRDGLERGLMTSLTQHIARCYLSKQWKMCLKAKLRLLSIMIS